MLVFSSRGYQENEIPLCPNQRTLKIMTDVLPLICGDSWGCGEWGYIAHNEYTILHGGLAQYLEEDGYETVNISKGGSSNLGAVHRLKQFAQSNPIDQYTIVWFQTDPFRDVEPLSVVNDISTIEELLIKQKTLLEAVYTELNSIGVKILCIGGTTKLSISISNYSNLIPVIPSVIEMLDSNLICPEIWMSNWVESINRYTNEDLLDFILANKRIQDSLFTHKLFIPDGRHPNRASHKIIYNHLKSKKYL
jgi:hypothetical protein